MATGQHNKKEKSSHFTVFQLSIEWQWCFTLTKTISQNIKQYYLIVFNSWKEHAHGKSQKYKKVTLQCNATRLIYIYINERSDCCSFCSLKLSSSLKYISPSATPWWTPSSSCSSWRQKKKEQKQKDYILKITFTVKMDKVVPQDLIFQLSYSLSFSLICSEIVKIHVFQKNSFYLA